MNSIHGFTNDILGDLDAVGIADLIKKKDVSVKEVVAAVVARANKVNPRINAIRTPQFEQAIAEAENYQSEGFFAGIPTFFKDLTRIKGLPTYHGSEAFYSDEKSTESDPVVKKILAQGFINAGMSTMPEFGFTCTTEFPDGTSTANPWNLAHSVGGSSGGAGALVAAGVVPLAHAADGGGSTRIPAACCGAIGLKATRGRMLLSDVFAQQVVEICIDGVITRSVRDTAYFYAEAEKYYHNKKLPKIGLVNRPINKKLSIGFTDTAGQGIGSDVATKQALDKTIKLLESLGHTVKAVEVPISDQMVEDFKCLWAMNAFFVKNFGKHLFKPPFDPKKLTKLTQGLSKFYWKHKLRTPLFISRIKKATHQYQDFLATKKIDILLTPTLAHLTPELGYLGMNLDFDELFPRMAKWACFTPYANASGCPSLSLPMGHDLEKNLPIGMLFNANFGEERLLLELAYQIEEAQPWKKIM